MGASTVFLRSLLKKRARQGKEDPERLDERRGIALLARPEGKLVWFHAASVGESQSTLILIDALLKEHEGLNVLVTSGTVSSAELMAKRLPKGAFHQYYPLDHPRWVARFLDHWKPDAAFWMESEIWPNMIKAIKANNIPAALINARLSERSFKRWKIAAGDIRTLLSSFFVILAQTKEDGDYFEELGAQNVIISDNLKYSAAPLSYDQGAFEKLKTVIADRPCWVYASTHDGEEEMACRIHSHLKKSIPDLLTIIVPRHPNRRDDVYSACEKYSSNITMRGEKLVVPKPSDDIYIADTMGELGLFYKLCPIACIGRSFSNDGGGGHNPIEAAQLGCAILYGPNVQNQTQIYKEFSEAGAALPLRSEQDFQNRLEKLLTDSDGLDALQDRAFRFVSDKSKVIELVISALNPAFENNDQDSSSKKCA